MKLDMDMTRELELDFDSSLNAEEKPINRFIFLSSLFHIVASAAIILTNHAPIEDVEVELVEIHVASPSNTFSAPEVAPVPEEAAPAPIAEEVPSPEEKVVVTAPPPPVVAKQIVEAVPAKPKTVVAPKQVTFTKAAKPSPPPTLDDIETPALDDDSATPIKVAKLNSQDLDQDLNDVDEQHNEQLNAVSTQIDNDAADVESSLEQSTESAADQIQKEDEAAAEQIAARAESLRKEQEANAAALVAAQDAEAEKLAAAEKANSSTGVGQKDAGPGNVSKEVRALENLRQMPGNPKPLYDASERLKGDKGIIVFRAFVTQDGRLTDFKLLQSTGHRNLDGKTLKALKQWKFYPGQEGWVELPFDWNLKGGPQEMPTFLRRKVGQGP